MIRAFINGMMEFRLSLTTHYTSYRCRTAYDYGREFMHMLTLRRYEA